MWKEREIELDQIKNKGNFLFIFAKISFKECLGKIDRYSLRQIDRQVDRQTVGLILIKKANKKYKTL